MNFLMMLNFNSTLVRLKVLCRSLMPLLIHPFQFHIGTIKSLSESAETGKMSLFQFHIGTIKRLYHSLFHAPFPHFNSTLVRLKDYVSR